MMREGARLGYLTLDNSCDDDGERIYGEDEWQFHKVLPDYKRYGYTVKRIVYFEVEDHF
jgi:hypothetical protein